MLIQDRSQLAAQLLGRLQGHEEETRVARGLLQGARQEMAGPWLRPLTGSLRRPGEPIELTFLGVSALAMTADGDRAVLGSGGGVVEVWDLDRKTRLHSVTDSADPVAVTPTGGSPSPAWKPCRPGKPETGARTGTTPRRGRPGPVRPTARGSPSITAWRCGTWPRRVPGSAASSPATPPGSRPPP